jgi:hypothetical protein
MINIRKFINSSLKTSNDIFSDVTLPLNKRVGFINGTAPIVPIYFYRYIGIDSTENEYYKQLNELDKALSLLKYLYLKFIDTIPLKHNSFLIDKVQFVWDRCNLEPFNNAKIESLITLFRGNGSLPEVKNSLLNSSIDESFSYTLSLYSKKEPSLNITKIKNFTLKLLSWINDFIPSLVKSFNIKGENGQDIINPKVIYFGDIKKHEIYFLIFLSRLGCDVLYINPLNHGDFLSIDKEGHYSKVLEFSSKIALKIDNLPKITHSEQLSKSNISGSVVSSINHTSNANLSNAGTTGVVKNAMPKQLFNIDKYKNSISPVYKTTINIIKDLPSPLTQRSGFVGKPMPLIPVYFYRYIGIKENSEEYYNELYKIDTQLSAHGTLYMKITSDLPVEANAELVSKTSQIWRTVPHDKATLMQLLVECDAFPNLKEDIINSSTVKNFSLILELYLEKEPAINTAKLKNFILKLLMWVYKYIPNLFKKFDYLKASTGEIYNPKILYYGDIKKHEAYFLIFLSLMGCDILYVNTKEDRTFSDIDKKEKFTKIIQLPEIAELKEFPKEEIILRHETAAFRASREIGSVIYNDDDGLYRPWQFESYKTYPLTLKTTYDELRILWREEARMRPGFKIENGTVYIPNLFAKISGVHKDLSVYWSEFKEFNDLDNIMLITKIPYVSTNYSRYDLYSLEYCFKDGLVDKESLFKNRLYRFSYLKTPLQNGIIDKINQLLSIPMFKNTVDTEFRLKILLNILSLDAQVLELIQKFDYPFKIPKLLIYHNDKEIFSEDDSIVLSFLNLIGFDIAIFTPTGYNNIEQRLLENYYDTHKLEDVKFELQLPTANTIRKNKDKANSFWSNLFK